MRSFIINVETFGDNVGFSASSLGALEVALLDLEQINSSRYFSTSSSLKLINVASKSKEIWVLNETLLVGLEVDHVSRVEANERHKEADISFSDSRASEVARLGENGFGLFQMFEQFVVCFFVSLLAFGESTSIHAIVDVGVDPRVQFLYLRAQMLGIQIQRRVLRQVVELLVEHANDIGRLVVYDALGDLIVKDGNSVVSRVQAIGLFVDLTKPLEAVVRVGELL